MSKTKSSIFVCPTCKAPKYESCRTLSTGQPTETHDARLKLLKESKESQTPDLKLTGKYFTHVFAWHPKKERVHRISNGGGYTACGANSDTMVIITAKRARDTNLQRCRNCWPAQKPAPR